MRKLQGLRVSLNGRLVPLSKARVPVFDRGMLFGDGVYETIRVYSRKPFRLREHLIRLAASAKRLGFGIPASFGSLAGMVARTVAANGFSEARARIVVTRGVGFPDLGATGKLVPTVLVYVTPYAGLTPKARSEGIRVIISRVRRNEKLGLDPAIKSLNMLNNLLAKQEARRRGAQDAILLNSRGVLTEATTANIFFVRRTTLFTPALSSGILAGITRGLVIGLARRLGFAVREAEFKPRALLRADEAFLTASTVEIQPVAALEGRRFPGRRPVTRVLQEAYRITVEDELGLAKKSGS